MLKRGEVDVAYTLRGAIAEDVRRTPGLTLEPVQFLRWPSMRSAFAALNATAIFQAGARSVDATCMSVSCSSRRWMAPVIIPGSIYSGDLA
jgi:hypothetical protein